MTYLIDGMHLHDPGYSGWIELRSTERHPPVTVTRPGVIAPGRHGRVPGMPSTYEPPAISITIGTPTSQLTELQGLIVGGTTLSRTHGKGSAQYELAAMNVRSLNEDHVELTMILELPGVFFRGPTTDASTPITQNTGSLDTWAGGTAPITDAILRVTGCSNPQFSSVWNIDQHITVDASVPLGHYLRVHCQSGRAWITQTDTWEGGTEVDPWLISYGAGPGFMELRPGYAGSEPTYNVGVGVDTADAGAQFSVRGKAAHIG